MKTFVCFFAINCFLVGVGLVFGSPKKYLPENGGFQPSNVRYFESDLPKSNQNASDRIDNKETKEQDRLQRFGIPIATYTSGAGVSSYNNNNPNGVAFSNPVKIDIGGVALGALLGLGAILILPKLANIFSTGHGYRSLENDMSSITELLTNVDKSLEKLNIDGASCVQRVVCNYVKEAGNNLKNGKASTMEDAIYAITSNALFSYMLDGTMIKEAVEIGSKSVEEDGNSDSKKCSSYYMKCPVNKENVMDIATSLLKNEDKTN